MDGSVLEGKSCFKILGFTISFKVDWVSYIISMAKSASKKIGALILPYSLAWNTIVMSGLVLLVATWICRIIYKNGYAGLLFLHSLLLLNPCLIVEKNIGSVSLFYRYYFGRCLYEIVLLALLPYCWGRSTRYSHRLHEYSITFPRCYKDVYVNRFFPRTARLSNSLPIECFPLSYDLNSYKSRIKRHFLTVGSF